MDAPPFLDMPLPALLECITRHPALKRKHISDHRSTATSMVYSKDATFSSKFITGTSPHHLLQIITGHYRQTLAHYRQITDIYVYMAFTVLPAIYLQCWFIFHRLQLVMKYYRHAGNVVMKSCISSLWCPALCILQFICSTEVPSNQSTMGTCENKQTQRTPAVFWEQRAVRVI